MIHNVREAFDEILDDVDWMDQKTRAAAKEKVLSANTWNGTKIKSLELVLSTNDWNGTKNESFDAYCILQYILFTQRINLLLFKLIVIYISLLWNHL